jgi:hypothetical protein
VLSDLPIEPTRFNGLEWQGPSPVVVPILRRLYRFFVIGQSNLPERETQVPPCVKAITEHSSIALL